MAITPLNKGKTKMQTKPKAVAPKATQTAPSVTSAWLQNNATAVFTSTGKMPSQFNTAQGSIKKATAHSAVNSRYTVIANVVKAHPKGFTLAQFGLVFGALKASKALTATSGTPVSYLVALTNSGYFAVTQ